MTTITMTSRPTSGTTTARQFAAGQFTARQPVAGAVTPVVTATRFLGHLLAALVGVAFLGRDLEH
ncbi:hypothetical protein [Saccharothrix stipae]